MKVGSHLPIKKSNIIILKISKTFTAPKKKKEERKHAEIKKWNLIGSKLKFEKRTNNLTDS